MTHNTLKRAGCTTVASVLDIPLERRFPRFGVKGREEVRLALRRHGIEPRPPSPSERAASLTALTRQIANLQQQMASDVRRWKQALARLTDIVRRLDS